MGAGNPVGLAIIHLRQGLTDALANVERLDAGLKDGQNLAMDVVDRSIYKRIVQQRDELLKANQELGVSAQAAQVRQVQIVAKCQAVKKRGNGWPAAAKELADSILEVLEGPAKEGGQ